MITKKQQKPGDTCKLTILIVDDDCQVLDFLCEFLEAKGFRVVTAPNGKLGMKQYRQCQPDLVLTDIVMPDMEGIEFILELQKINTNAGIIAMSGGNSGRGCNWLGYANLLGANGTLSKPFTNEELMESMQYQLARKSLKIQTNERS